MDEHAPRLARLARMWCDDRSDAADLVQDTFERVMRRGGIPPEVRSPCGYLVTTMKNLLRDRRRARSRRPVIEPLREHPETSPDETPVWSAFELEDIRAALAELAPVYRDTFILHALEHRGYDELAVHFAIRPATVGTRLTRARKLLRAALQKRTATVPA
jgi:RNA polymerase sigma-70 factor, ECF subfamily